MMDWKDLEDIGLALLETHPDVEPLTVRFTQLRDWVLALPGFAGDPEKVNEKILEAVQMAWYEEWQDEYGA